MNKALLLRLHRWTTLVFALPLLVVIATGLILSVEPIAMTSGARSAAIDAARMTTLLQRHDPEGKARGIALRAYADELAIMGLDGGPRFVSLATGEARAEAGALPALFTASRQIHERLLFGLDWLVVASTVAMVVVIALGLLMGLPVLRNTVGGWHKGVAWFLLPLVIASPVTGLMLAWNITFASPPPAGGGAGRLPIAQALRVVAAEHDLENVVWLRSRGPNLLARVVVDGEYRVYAVGRDGLRAQPRNWPRLIHEGVWDATLASILNVVTSIALLALLGTGLFMWARRKLRRRGRSAPRAVPA